MIVPENNRPMATGPAAGSNTIFTTIIIVGPSSSPASKALPISDSKSPFQICGILYLIASCGAGWCFTTIPRTASANGAFSISSGSFSTVYASITSLKLIPRSFIKSALIAHLSLAEPNVTLES